MPYVPRCVHCDEVIGMYEPAIVINGRGVQATSRTAQPLLGAGEETVYHRACYEPLAGDGDVPEGAAAD